jgi:hypothetical protein
MRACSSPVELIDFAPTPPRTIASMCEEIGMKTIEDTQHEGGN